jgi:class 3 adenylate cyclase
MNTTATRRLAAILAADVVGYSRLMGADEEGTHERLKAHLREVVDPKIRDHHGRIVISDAAGAWPRPPQNDCASQEGATPKPGAVRGPMWRSSECSRSGWDGEFESPFLQRGIAANSKPSRLLTVGNRASLMRRSTISGPACSGRSG